MIARSDLAEVIGERTLHIGDIDKLTHAVAGFLLEQNRVSELDSLMRDVQKYRAGHGIVEATVISAYPLSASVRNEVMRAIKEEFPNARTYTLNPRIDESVVGGLRIEFAGEELDLTIQSRLNTFKRLTAARNN